MGLTKLGVCSRNSGAAKYHIRDSQHLTYASDASSWKEDGKLIHN